MTTGTLRNPQERVLSTLNLDGSRRWLRPRVSPGRFLTARRITAYVLIAIFTLLPHLRIGGKPAILLDVVHRQFIFFGVTFLPTDTLLLALLVVGWILSIFLVTAIFGRAWCGYACPQTVYLEFVFRPLERLFDGPPGRGGAEGRKKSGPRTAAKYVVYLVVSAFLAHTFLAYFVGVDALERWIFGSPFEHPTAFAVMAVTTGLMMFDFCYFREQLCIVACPYGRFQSVLLDRDSLIVSYDPVRGEPRGKPRREPQGQEETATLDVEQRRGDCIDCGLCVDTCPTGIDIRDGLKMECVGCAQCIDACDAVMEKLSRPRGLIRYSSQSRISREASRLLRPRVIIYPTLLLAVAVLFSFVLARKEAADVTLVRGVGMPFVELPGGQISNQLRMKITNRTRDVATYRVELAEGEPGRIVIDESSFSVEPAESVTKNIVIIVPPTVFSGGRYEARLRVTDGQDFSKEVSYRLYGPQRAAASEEEPARDSEGAGA